MALCSTTFRKPRFQVLKLNSPRSKSRQDLQAESSKVLSPDLRSFRHDEVSLSYGIGEIVGDFVRDAWDLGRARKTLTVIDDLLGVPEEFSFGCVAMWCRWIKKQ